MFDSKWPLIFLTVAFLALASLVTIDHLSRTEETKLVVDKVVSVRTTLIYVSDHYIPIMTSVYTLIAEDGSTLEVSISEYGNTKINNLYTSKWWNK